MAKIGTWSILLVCSLPGFSECRASTPDSLVCPFQFRLGDDLLMLDHRDNKRTFQTLGQWMTPENISRISSMRIVGAASPEGGLSFNNLCAWMEAVERDPDDVTTETPDKLTAVAADKPFLSKRAETSFGVAKSFHPLFAVKTNLLFDAATLLNVELEVPVGKRWSVAGEWICPWWLWEKKQHCLQVLSGNLEGKYWFGNREVSRSGRPRLVMTGWNAGVYAGGGYYDLEWDEVGYQGEFFIAAGISGGYAHAINKSGSLRLEYSVGIGYMQTHYRKYDAERDADSNWHLYHSSNGRYTWVGPTRARISLVWMLNGKKKGGPTQ